MALLQEISSRLATYPLEEEIANDITFNLEEVDGGPLSPPCNDAIPVDDEFRAERFIDAFIQNLMHRQAKLSVPTWREIVSFVTGDPANLSTRIGLQLLVHFSKVDPVELLAQRQQTYDHFITVVCGCLSSLNAVQMADDRIRLAKDFLKRPLIMDAIKSCLKDVGKEERVDFDDARITALIESMEFFETNSGLTLRGACLLNGVLVNTRRVETPGISENDRADFFTLIGHETIHFLIRQIENNFNWSSPFTGVAQDEERVFSSDRNRKLELGRLFELKIFDMQPSWRDSTKIAAASFLRLLDNPSATVSTISVDEFKGGLIPRPYGSICMAIDLEDDVAMFE